MRQSSALLIIVTLIMSCSNQNNTKIAAADLAVDSAASIPSLFADINANGLHIYTPDDTTNGKKFEGKPIDPRFYKYLQFEDNLAPFSDTVNRFFSCFKFNMTSPYIGLIVRRPSQYEESAIDLYIWDNSKKEVVGITPLTDA